WTAPRLARSSGYGAGVVAPGWCAHLWALREDTDRGATWLAKVAGVLRARGFARPSRTRLPGAARGGYRVPLQWRARGLGRCRGGAADRFQCRIDSGGDAACAAARRSAAPAEGDALEARG